MPQAIITVNDLVKRYKKSDTNAVDHVSFEVPAGQFFALLGPNGAGKTTIISILTTTLAQTSGSVSIAGRDLARAAAAVRREVGIIFQKPSLDLNLTAEENVRLHAILYGLYPFRPTFGTMPKPYRDQLLELANFLELEREIFKPIKTYSGGMKRKLEIIRSLMHKPKVLFLDEPTIGLDPTSRRSLWEYLDKVRRSQGTTIFLTTHYLDEAEDADAICIIDHGRIVAQGTPVQIKQQLAREFLIIDAQDRDALRRELKELKLEFAEKPAFHINLNGHNAYEIIKSLQTPLTELRTHSPSLEDAYMRIVSSEAIAGAEAK